MTDTDLNMDREFEVINWIFETYVKNYEVKETYANLLGIIQDNYRFLLEEYNKREK